MKRFFSMACFIAIVAVLTSCSKEKADTPSPVLPRQLNEKLLLKTDLYYDDVTFTYYPDRKLKTFSYKSGANETRYDFVYNGNTITKTYNYNGVPSDVTVYTLNSKGFATQNHYTHYDANGNILIQSSSNFYYNANDQLIKREYSNGERSEFVYDANGNLIASHSFNSNGVEEGSTKYEYYTDKINKWMSYSVTESNGNGGFQGYPSKNLLKKQTSIYKGSLWYEGEFTYELDAEGFTTGGKIINLMNGTTEEWKHIYQ